MSAPETNLRKQKRRHKPTLIGIGLAVLIALGALVYLGLWGGSSDEDPEVPAASDQG